MKYLSNRDQKVEQLREELIKKEMEGCKKQHKKSKRQQQLEQENSEKQGSEKPYERLYKLGSKRNNKVPEQTSTQKHMTLD